MSRRVLILASDALRDRAVREIAEAPLMSRVEIKDPQRTLAQNSRFWAMLTDISRQVEHVGRYYSAEEWRSIVLHALGRDVQFLPSLDGRTFIPLGMSSADLSKEEMSAAIEFMYSEFVPRGVVFHEPAPKAEMTRGAA